MTIQLSSAMPPTLERAHPTESSSGLRKTGEAEERPDGHRDDKEGCAQHDPAVVGRAVGHGVSILPSRTGIRRHRVAAMMMPSAAHGTAKPPSRSAASPKIGGQMVTPKDEMARPRPMAVPAL